MRTDHQLTTRSAGEPLADTAASFVFSHALRRVGSGAIVVVGAVAVGLSALAYDDRNGYVLAHALAGAPLQLGALICAQLARRSCPPQYRLFWRRWCDACLVATLATLAAIGAVVLASPVLLLVDMVLMVVAVPFWSSAALQMLRAQAGQRDASVDVVDAAMALLVLGTPGVLLVAEPLLQTADIAFAGPFAFFLLIIPGGLYGACLNVARVPRGERVTQGLGVALAAAFTVSVALQLAHVLGGLDLPLPVFVGFHVLNVGLVMALPLWAHRVVSGGLGRLPVERQVRRSNPMPTIGAVVLPLLALYVLVVRGDDRWAVGYLTAVLLAVVVLNAVRHAMLSREARRLAGELAHMAEERRQLLANMVRALDDDRHRAVSELHTQAVGSLSTLGTVVQTACVSLPADTASVVRETIAQLQGDLTARAEQLRLLMTAMRPPPFDPAAPGGKDDPLAAALRAYASDLRDERPPGLRPEVEIAVDPQLELDRTTMTIAYRIAQEALLNAVRHSGCTRVLVAVGADEAAGGITVEVTDDGSGFVVGEAGEGSGLASLQLFTDLGRGHLTVLSAPGEGTCVRSRLGVRAEPRRPCGAVRAEPAPVDAAMTSRPGRRHLRLVAGPEATRTT